LIERYGEKRGAKIWARFEVHYTPKHASWLNQAEIAIGIYSQQCLGKDRVGTIKELKSRSKAWNKRTQRRTLQAEIDKLSPYKTASAAFEKCNSAVREKLGNSKTQQ